MSVILSVYQKLTEICILIYIKKHLFFLMSNFILFLIARWMSPKSCLKLVSTIFYQMFIFSSNDSPLKDMTNVFYFIEKALFVLFSIFKFLHFFLHIPDYKWAYGNKIIMMSWIGLHKFATVIFGITQKSLYITSSNLFR